MDVWHASLLYNLLVIHVMLPFSRSDLNVFALGPNLLRGAQSYVTEAYLISAFGYAGILLGGNLWRVYLGVGIRELLSHVIELPSRGSLVLLRSKHLLVIHGTIASGMLLALILYYFKTSGFGFDVGSLVIVDSTLRPIAQFINFYAVLVASYCLARFQQYREHSMLFIVVTLACGMLFFGSRSAIGAIFLMTITVLYIKLKRRLKIIWLLTGGLFALCMVFVLDALRQANFSLVSAAGKFAVGLFYGNSFSDTRDFAAVLSLWDGHYFLGKTYLAALFAFVPRFLSSFRDTWSLGVVTATLAGFKPAEHPGLRIGIFGEAYMNFGLPAVLLLSLFVGAVMRLIDLRMKQYVAILPQSDMRVYSLYILTLLVTLAENSTTASTFYSIFLVILISWIMLRVFAFLKLPIT
jgi:oligosaccharide repeat unit polymerase